MRRVTESQLIDQAKLLLSLLMSGSTSNLLHHVADFERYFRNLHDLCLLTHSVSPRFPEKNNALLGDLTAMLQDSTVNLKTIIRLRLVLEDIVERRIRFTPNVPD